MATVGKNILDNLTTGMYSDSKVIYREYIQNACDQIDLAIREGILSADEGYVDIYIDSKKRYISIKDNATGIKTTDFTRFEIIKYLIVSVFTYYLLSRPLRRIRRK